jgi:hypothetical protein
MAGRTPISAENTVRKPDEWPRRQDRRGDRAELGGWPNSAVVGPFPNTLHNRFCEQIRHAARSASMAGCVDGGDTGLAVATAVELQRTQFRWPERV